MSHRPNSWLNTTPSNGNDIWGWTDPSDNREYVLMGTAQSTVVVDITDATNPELVFRIQTQTAPSSWRDIKVYNDHAFIVSEALAHGVQVVDLRVVRTVDRESVPDIHPIAVYRNVSRVHNLVINEESGFAYAVGSRSSANNCSGGLHAIDIRDPSQPVFAGCFSEDGYTHDAQCVIYRGPDAEHLGKEICIASNTNTVTIVDFSDKTNPIQISRSEYPTSGYIHQGWLTDDHEYFLSNDELDESNGQAFTRTFVWDMSDLDNPNPRVFTHSTMSIDHNLYIQKDFVFMANYNSGFRMYKLDREAAVDNERGDLLQALGHFDTVPDTDLARFGGSWSNYPYFCSGNIAVSNMAEGLFIIRPHDQSFISENCTNGSGLEKGPFTASIQDEAIQLSWSTLSEDNILGFNIEFAVDSPFLESIAYIEGQNIAGGISEYSYQIPLDGPGEYSVRVKALDINGNFNYWPTKKLEVEIPGDEIVYDAYPNPFSSSSRIRFATRENQWVSAKLYDSIGREFAVIFEGLTSGGRTHSLDIDGRGLAPGVYLIVFEGTSFTETKAVVLNN